MKTESSDFDDNDDDLIKQLADKEAKEEKIKAKNKSSPKKILVKSDESTWDDEEDDKNDLIKNLADKEEIEAKEDIIKNLADAAEMKEDVIKQFVEQEDVRKDKKEVPIGSGDKGMMLPDNVIGKYKFFSLNFKGFIIFYYNF